MTVARMWESRLEPGAVAGFFEEVTRVAWPAFVAAPGFTGGEVYRSGGDGGEGELRAVIVTRWVDVEAAVAAEGVEARLARFAARDPHCWVFEQLELTPVEEPPRH